LAGERRGAGLDEVQERRQGSTRERSGGGDAPWVRGAARGQEPSGETISLR
jgi:hypothetical protein